MPETVTESFCERCGTSYTFSAPARLNPLRKTRGVVSGLKNYLTSTDPLKDAVADALQVEVESLSDRQMEAYHSVFSFCIECRQYACREKCWNDTLGRCLSCAPRVARDASVAAWPGQDLLAPLFAETPEGADVAAPAQLRAPEDAVAGWDVAQIEEPSPPTTAEPMSAPDATEEEPLVADIEPADVVEPADDDPRFGLAWEAEEGVVPPAPPAPARPRPVPARRDAPTDASESAPSRREMADVVVLHPSAAPAETQDTPLDEPVAAEALPVAPSVPREPAFPEIPAERIAAVVETPEAAARRAQLETLGISDPSRQVQVAASAETPVVLPHRQSSMRQLVAAAAPLWDASTKEVSGRDGNAFKVRDCEQCGLSLSAHARFCRRCGMRQAQPA